MSRIYLTSDFHFGHDKDFLYGPRGFDNIYDHDKCIIQLWNEIVNDDDLVYVLGDLMLKDNEYGTKCFNQLKGFKEIIIGNHDTNNRLAFYPHLRGVIDVKYADVFKYGQYSFYVSHYPTITSSHDYPKPLNHRMLNLCGHTHTNDKFTDWDKGFIYHCELDAHCMKPISIEQIITDIEEKNSIGA